MAQVPALCRSCGTWFNTGVALIGRVRLTGNRSRCPSCGQMGSIPDGIFDFEAGIVTLVEGPPRTVADLQNLAAFLDDAREKESTRDEIGSTIAERFPMFSGLVSLLPHNRAELYGFLALLLVAITLILSQSHDQSPTVVIGDLDINVRNVTDEAMEEFCKPSP